MSAWYSCHGWLTDSEIIFESLELEKYTATLQLLALPPIVQTCHCLCLPKMAPTPLKIRPWAGFYFLFLFVLATQTCNSALGAFTGIAGNQHLFFLYQISQANIKFNFKIPDFFLFKFPAFSRPGCVNPVHVQYNASITATPGTGHLWP